MKQLIPMDEHGMFADYNDTALVDSRFVADAFEQVEEATRSEGDERT